MPHKKKDQSAKAARKAWYKNPVWYFFNSLKLTLGVLITLAAVSIIGTIIEQNQPIQNYIQEYGEGWTKFIVKTGMNDMYHSWWFLALLAALALNIIVCTFERFPPKWRSLLNHKKDFRGTFIDKLSNSQTVTVPGDPSTARDKVLGAFKSKRYKTMVTEEGGEYRIYAWKGAIGRLGSDVTHISLLLILLGAIVGSFYGYKDFKTVFVGGTVDVPNETFQIRLDKFWIDYYDTGQIRQYNSMLTVIDGGEEVMEKQIWVNEPLYYKGVRFYQSTYGMAWNRIEKASVALVKKGKDELGDPVVVKWNEMTEVPGTPYDVKLVGYTADFAYDERSQTVYSKSAESNNPAIMLEIYKDGKMVSSPWLFLNYPGIFPALPDSEDDLVLTGFRGIMYSGLSVNKDPGTNIVWLGTAVMGAGFILAFFVYHRRVWVVVKNSANSTEMRIGGIINKNNLVFEKDIKDIVDAVKD